MHNPLHETLPDYLPERGPFGQDAAPANAHPLLQAVRARVRQSTGITLCPVMQFYCHPGRALSRGVVNVSTHKNKKFLTLLSKVHTHSAVSTGRRTMATDSGKALLQIDALRAWWRWCPAACPSVLARLP